jgi:type II secretory pathway pseudopilin PulG
MERVHSQRGLSVVELTAALTVVAAIALAAVPPLVEIVHNSRLRAAARHLAGEMQQARARAVGTGWEYRIFGFGAAAGNGYRNRYRVLARSLPVQAWPDETAPPSESATLVVGEWIAIDDLFPGVQINAGDGDGFALTFDSRGVPIERSLNFDPLNVSNASGIEKFLTVSSVGNVAVD